MAHKRLDRAVRLTGNEKWGSRGWFQFHMWQNRVVGAAFLVVGLLALLGVIDVAD